MPLTRCGVLVAPDLSPGPGPATGTWCTDLELSGPLPPVLPVPAGPGGRCYGSVRVLARLHGVPLGFIELPSPGSELDVQVLLKAIDSELLDAVNEHLSADAAVPVGSVAQVRPAVEGDGCASHYRPADDVTVVVGTRDRPEMVRGCLNRLRRLGYPRLEFILVDNAPSDDSTRKVFDEVVGSDSRFRYLREPKPGVASARNCGLRAATGSLIAFTDDDVLVDLDWIRALATVFRDPAVAGVTGLICTASIDGPSERYFDARAGWAIGFRPAAYRIGGDTDHGIFPYSPGSFGATANFAARTAVLRELGGFDELLGPGTRAAGGEDLDLFVRIILSGWTLAYEPSVMVWHQHRADLDSLRRQMFVYGTGLSAFLTKHLLDPSTRWEVLRRAPRGLGRIITIATRTQHSLGSSRGGAEVGTAAPDEAVPARAMLLRELAGFVVGPFRYLRGRRASASAG